MFTVRKSGNLIDKRFLYPLNYVIFQTFYILSFCQYLFYSTKMSWVGIQLQLQAQHESIFFVILYGEFFPKVLKTTSLWSKRVKKHHFLSFWKKLSLLHQGSYDQSELIRNNFINILMHWLHWFLNVTVFVIYSS